MNIEKLIADYRYKHPLAEQLGGEFIMQSDVAQIDAIQLVCDIFENVSLMQEPCEDCVSREEAVTEINKYHMTSGVTHQCVWNECVGVIAETIQELPPVTLQIKTGHWINVYPDIEPNPMFMYGICSVCGFEQSISIKLNFCPKCGAKMVEPQESEDK